MNTQNDAGSAKTYRDILITSRAYARHDTWRSVWQVMSTIALFAAVMVVVWALSETWWYVALTPVLGGIFTRVFILQHDCGHRSLFGSKRANDRVGQMLSMFTGVPYAPWREEHTWHHHHQGKLDKRGVDRTNSPLTVAEAAEDPQEARRRKRLIRWPVIWVMGLWSLVVKRKRLAGFFFNRAGFEDRGPDPKEMRRSFALTLLSFATLHGAGCLIIGVGVWLSTYALALIIGAGVGVSLFWVQHNFEETYHADSEQWHHAAVALHGSSYLRLDPISNWFTGHIGLHHVHHLNARIPNYRLEEARCGIEALREIKPMTFAQIRDSVHMTFWDTERDKMVHYDDLDATDR